jgi:2-methyl-3-hydroxypyridine 5-carboxylic acid dioxygenase
MTRRAVIAGAGFAGLAAAAALARNGWKVRVHETDPEPRSAGGGIYVHGFVHDALRKIDAFDRFATGSFAPPAHCLYIDGVLQARTPTGGQYLTTTRAILHAALMDAAARAGVEIIGGSRAIGAEAGGALILEDGTRLEADLVVSADGVRSTIARALAIPLTRVPHQDGITRVLLDRSGLHDETWNDVHDYYDYAGRPLRVLYTPCGPDAFYFCLMAPVSDVEATSIPIATELWTDKFPELVAPLQRIGSAGRHDRYATTTLANWSKGCVAVVGDAAHAMPSSLGQGAGVSIINAVALADAVAHAPDIAAALVAWEVAMRPTVEAWQRRVEDVASQRSLSRTVHGGERPLVEISAASPHRKFLNADAETTT